MTERPSPDSLRQALLARRGTAERTPSCLPDATVAALAAGTLDATQRDAALRHLGDCAFCREAVASVARALADRSVAREIAASEGRGPARRLAWLVPLAAAAALLVVLWPSSDDGGPVTVRDRPAANANAPRPIAPRDAVARLNQLIWSRVPGAVQYRIRLYDADGGVLWTAETPDTLAIIPASIRLVPRTSYFWKVEARAEPMRWSGSDLVEFRVTESSP